MAILTLLALLLAPSDVRVSMLDGQSHSGQLAEISTSAIALIENGTEAKLPVADVMSIDFPKTLSKPSEEPQVLTLTDGSQLYGSEITRSAKQLTARSATFGMLNIESKSVQ